MIAGIFALGCLIICFGLMVVVHNEAGIFPLPFPYLDDTTSIIVIGLALVTVAVIFRIPIKK